MKRRDARGSRRRPSLNSAETVIREVIQHEERVWKAAKQRNVEEFKALVPADAVMIFQSGIIRQPEYLDTMRDRTIRHYEMRDIHGFMPNSKTVILIYRAVRLGSYKGKAFPSQPVIESSTWIKRGKRWVAILNQETPIQNDGSVDNSED